MASAVKKNGKFTNKNSSKTKTFNCERREENIQHASFDPAETKENQSDVRGLRPSYLSRIQPKLQSEMFNFSSESEDEVENLSKSPLREQNLNLSKSSFPHKIFVDSPGKHFTKDNCIGFTPRKSTVMNNINEDPNLEWESLLESSHHSKHQTASGKKKLFSGTNDDVHFHSTPKEAKNRIKLKNSLLWKGLSQKPDLERFKTYVSGMDRNKNDEIADFDQDSEMGSQDEFVEVLDSSAQTSFQPEVVQQDFNKYQTQSTTENNYLKTVDLSTEANYTHNLNDNQGVRQENLNADTHEFTHPSNSTSEERQSETSLSSSIYHSQGSLDFDDNLATKLSQGSLQSSQSIVEVQDASVQVESVLCAEQADLSNLLSGSGSIEPDKSFGTSLERQSDPGCKQNNSNFPYLRERCSKGNSETESECVEDNNDTASTSSTSSVFVSASEVLTGRHNCSDQSRMLTSETNNCTGNPANSPDGTDILQINETESNNDSDELLTSQDKPSVLAVNTDTSDSDSSSREEPKHQHSWRVQASFSDASVSDGDSDLIKDEEELVTGGNSFCESEVGTKTNEKVGRNLKKSVSTGEDPKINLGNDCNEESEAFYNVKSNSVTELSDMMKSTTISRRRRYSDSSDEDDAFEKYLAKIKAPAQTQADDETIEMEKSMSEFIASDDEDLSHGSLSQSGSSEDEMFHVRVDSRRRSRKESFSHSEEESSEESERDDKPKPVLKLSSDDEDLLDDFPKDVGKLPDPIESSSSLNSLGNEIPQTPKAKFSLKADDDDQDDFKTPFKTPKKPAKLLKVWERPFETPAADQRRKPFSEFKDKRGCPMTVSRLHHLSRRSNIDLDDDSIFLKSLSEDYPDYKRHPEASRYIKYFKDKKADLTKRLFAIYNKSIFKEQLPADLEMEWSALYRKTAGTFCYRASTREAKITLSVKVCDRAERVRDTLAHELCHAAVRLINGVKEGHGPVWRSWAQKVNRAFPFMPVIARCHDYVIATKYTYQCTKCNYRIGRHSKSLDTDKKVCGHCLGKFEVYLTRDLNSVCSEGERTPHTPRTPRTPNRFALFVKESYAEVKKQDNSLKHADVMKILSRQFSEKTKIHN